MKKATETVCWQWADPKHFEAHQDDFIRPVGEILEELHGFLPPFQAASKSDKPIVLECELEEPVGRSGLKVVRPEADKKDESFWAYRRGRAIPSHLIFAEKELTRWVCLWGWRKEDSFVIHTIYPGRSAPREIHDPAITVDQLSSAIEFWRCHAIVVTDKGEFSLEPEA